MKMNRLKFTNTLISLNYLLSFGSSTCPDVSPMENFNTSEYIRASWYIQQQQVTGYQPKETLYCVAQTLNNSHKIVPFFRGNILDVYNYGNIGKVNGIQENKKNITLCARQVNSSLPSRILNGPCFLPNFLAGPYWVLAAGPYSYNYSWAIVSGGPPTIVYADGNCSTKLNGTNGSGLWLFTRERLGINVKSYVETMRNILINFGYTTSQLLNVIQEGCLYDGAYLK